MITPSHRLLMRAVHFAVVRKFVWRIYYEHVSRGLSMREGFDFLNLGLADPGMMLQLNAQDEPCRLQIQLYHRIAGCVSLVGQDVLEVGCGRGGGASFVARYLNPRSVVAVDLASAAIRTCTRRHQAPGLRFQQGDAESLSFGDGMFDAVINVESSHCYGNIDKFFREAARVLRAGGHFLYGDLCLTAHVEGRRRQLTEAGFEIVEEEDLSEKVLRSRDQVANAGSRRIAQLFGSRAGVRSAPFWLEPGTYTYDLLKSRLLAYPRWRLRKIG